MNPWPFQPPFDADNDAAAAAAAANFEKNTTTLPPELDPSFQQPLFPIHHNFDFSSSGQPQLPSTSLPPQATHAFSAPFQSHPHQFQPQHQHQHQQHNAHQTLHYPHQHHVQHVQHAQHAQHAHHHHPHFAYPHHQHTPTSAPAPAPAPAPAHFSPHHSPSPFAPHLAGPPGHGHFHSTVQSPSLFANPQHIFSPEHAAAAAAAQQATASSARGSEPAVAVAVASASASKAASARATRTQHLPPTFASDDDDDGDEEQSAQPGQGLGSATDIKPEPTDASLSAMVSTRGAGNSVNYAEDTGDDAPPAPARRPTRRGGRNGMQAGDDSDVSYTQPKQHEAPARPSRRPSKQHTLSSPTEQRVSAHEEQHRPGPSGKAETSSRMTRSTRATAAEVAIELESEVYDPQPSRGAGSRRRKMPTWEQMQGSQDSSDPLGGDIPANDARAHEDEDDAEGEDDDEDEDEAIARPARQTRSGRPVKSYKEEGDEDSDDFVAPPKRRSGTSKTLGDFVVNDEEEDGDEDLDYGQKRRGRLSRGGPSNRLANLAKRKAKSARGNTGRGRRRDEEYADIDDLDEEQEDAMSGDDSEHTDDQNGGRNYALRQRKKVDYSMAAPPASPPRDGFGRPIKRSRGSKPSSGPSGGAFELDSSRAATLGLPGGVGPTRKGKTGWDALPMSMTGKDYAKAFGDEVDSSDDDIPAARKAQPPPMFGGAAGAGGAGLLGNGPTPLGGAGAADGNTGSARDAMGRIKKGGDALADVDPLGVNMQVDFDAVGGLDGHIQQLKEMVSLPLLYPEVFQRFKVTPPRGVLFHGPPGTGKTLVARALAASCSTSGQQISFFMRKGADCLSKWVGEAERQLRMLFDEARASQPSIIFFDEIDGLAPVRSSKQDQIHASIVSTLLALMDGMDGRGQVVVIGATNRPDSVDPALRRPGRFDREFYFPLPSKEARRSIINIHTKGWEPPLSDDFKDKLSEVTKGYGGADLRALCTEAALNAVQRRYPQIYQTTERLLLQPETIRVEAKDFMMSVNKLVPSSARSASSAAAPLPDYLRPILGATVDQAVAALKKIMPAASKRNPLEEAMWEDEPFSAPLGSGPDSGTLTTAASDGGFGREMMLQAFESLRVFRPRLVIYGQEGMGQSFVGGALLHHLEGYHVQSLDIGALMGDSARTPEASVVQLFVEAKRHKPSVIFIPGLSHWANSVSETVRSTTKALLDELAPSDPILLLAIAEAPLSKLPSDVAKWFGYLTDNKVEAALPDVIQTREFFNDMLEYIKKPPTEFPDALPRRRRVLEVLPKAPPKAPRLPTAAELQQQAADDQRTLEHLKYRLGPVLGELRKKFKKFTRDVWDEYNLHNLTMEYDTKREKGKVIVRLRYQKGFRQRRASSADDDLLAVSASQQASGRASVQPPSASQPNPSASASEGAGDVSMADGSRLDGPHPTPETSTRPTDSSLLGAMSFETAQQPGGPAASTQSAPTLVQPAPSELPQANGGVGEHAAAAASTGAQPNGPNAPPQDDDMFDYRDMPIWTMNLERMQRRLYYNGYLTIQDFMDDLAKIVSNAEEAREVDTERVVRAHQMRNLAVVLLDQYIDVNFRLECERMAQRQLAREQEKQKAEDDAKRAIEEATASGRALPPPRPSGERASARVQGEEPEHQHPVDVIAIERSGKRSRGASARLSAGNADGGDRKRARSALIGEVDGLIQGAGAGSTMATDVASGSAQAQTQLQQEPSSTTPTNGTTHGVNGNGSGGGAGGAMPAVPLGSAPTGAIGEQPPQAAPPSPPKPHPHPPFRGPSNNEFCKFVEHLLKAANGLNIEQLLQLRAGCFDAVWRRRADWDRRELLGELHALVDAVTSAVREEREAAARERERWEEGM